MTQDREVRCFECEGYGHYKTECPNYLKKQKKGMTTTWSDLDEDEGEIANKVIAFTEKFDTNSASSEDLIEEELVET
ncbi:keratin type I cytoskeletal 9-like, partial [Trifolium medium]|nr:keratin type I cytoskeletal 9-like [Trifolium medium]